MDRNNIEYGYCHCGCGQKTNLIKQTIKSKGQQKGEPRKYLLGHFTKGSKIPQRSGANSSSWNGGRSVNVQGYVRLLLPLHPRRDSRGYVYEHIILAEQAMGKSLPHKAVVHHYTPEQLVVCQDQAYHMLLHKRMKALRECGHANWLNCPFCHKYDDPINMRIYDSKTTKPHHVVCFNNYQLKRKLKLRQAAQDAEGAEP